MLLMFAQYHVEAWFCATILHLSFYGAPSHPLPSSGFGLAESAGFAANQIGQILTLSHNPGLIAIDEDFGGQWA